MKINMRLTILTTTVTILATAFLTTNLQAQGTITGSIGFGSQGTAITGTDLGSATSFTPIDPFITGETGSYSGVTPSLGTLLFPGFNLNPPPASVQTLWSFQADGLTYSYDATTVIATFNNSLNEWDIGGDGIASISGYTSTAGTWNINLSQSGASVVFDSSAAIMPTPEGSTLALMTAGLVGLAGLARDKFRY
jgi:hypothetical protein